MWCALRWHCKHSVSIFFSSIILFSSTHVFRWMVHVWLNVSSSNEDFVTARQHTHSHTACNSCKLEIYVVGNWSWHAKRLSILRAGWHTFIWEPKSVMSENHNVKMGKNQSVCVCVCGFIYAQNVLQYEYPHPLTSIDSIFIILVYFAFFCWRKQTWILTRFSYRFQSVAEEAMAEKRCRMRVCNVGMAFAMICSDMRVIFRMEMPLSKEK